jgi:hypothetical protein
MFWEVEKPPFVLKIKNGTKSLKYSSSAAILMKNKNSHRNGNLKIFRFCRVFVLQF